MRPGAGRKPSAGSSALIRHSMAWPVGADLVLGPRQGPAGGDLDLRDHEVEPGPHLGDRVLDLEPAVHLHEPEDAVVEEHLHRAGADVADLGGGGRGRAVAGGGAQVGDSAGDGDSSISFWWWRWTVQSRSNRWTARPCLSPKTWTSTWRPPSISFSR